MKMIHYIHKGMNCLTEMYSAIKAEVPVSDDPSTELNRTLLSELRQADKLILLLKLTKQTHFRLLLTKVHLKLLFYKIQKVQMKPQLN